MKVFLILIYTANNFRYNCRVHSIYMNRESAETRAKHLKAQSDYSYYKHGFDRDLYDYTYHVIAKTLKGCKALEKKIFKSKHISKRAFERYKKAQQGAIARTNEMTETIMRAKSTKTVSNPKKDDNCNSYNGPSLSEAIDNWFAQTKLYGDCDNE